MRGHGSGRRRALATGAILLLSGAAGFTPPRPAPEPAQAPAAPEGVKAVDRSGPAPLDDDATPSATAVFEGAIHFTAAPALALAPAFTIDWSPARPVQGTLFTVRVRPAGEAIERVTGEFAGEPLHFEPGDGGFTALAAVPVDATGEVALRVEVRAAGGRAERRTESVPVAPGEYRVEKLTVAPRYGGGYDAATTARIRREAARAREVSRRSHGTPRLWAAPFVRPRPGRVTSGFGGGREFNGRIESRHTGTDFAGQVGAPVRAAARGVVRVVDSFYLGGNVVYIDHGAGLVTGYLHLSGAAVAEGDTVAAGQTIGRVGATGRVTGPHLHWIVRYGGISVDGLSLPGIER